MTSHLRNTLTDCHSLTSSYPTPYYSSPSTSLYFIQDPPRIAAIVSTILREAPDDLRAANTPRGTPRQGGSLRLNSASTAGASTSASIMALNFADMHHQQPSSSASSVAHSTSAPPSSSSASISLRKITPRKEPGIWAEVARLDAEVAVIEKEQFREKHNETAVKIRCDLDAQTSARRQAIQRERAQLVAEGDAIAASAAAANKEAREKAASKVAAAAERQAAIDVFTKAEAARKKTLKEHEWELEAAAIRTQEENLARIAARSDESKAAAKAIIKASMAGNADLLRMKAAAKAAEQAAEVEANRIAVARMDAAEAARTAGIDATKLAQAAKLARMGDYVKAKEEADKAADQMMEDARLKLVREAEEARLRRKEERRLADLDFKAVVETQLQAKREVKRENVEADRRALIRAKESARDAEMEEAALKVAKIDAATNYAHDLDILVAKKAQTARIADVTPLEATFTAKFLEETRTALAKGGKLRGF